MDKLVGVREGYGMNPMKSAKEMRELTQAAIAQEAERKREELWDRIIEAANRGQYGIIFEEDDKDLRAELGDLLVGLGYDVGRNSTFDELMYIRWN